MKQETDSILSFVEKVVDEIGIKAGHVIPILHAIQKKYNYLPESALRKVCEIRDNTCLYNGCFDLLFPVPAYPDRETHHPCVYRHGLSCQRV